MMQDEARLQDMVNELSAEVERLKENQMTEYQRNRLQEAEENYLNTLEKLKAADYAYENLFKDYHDLQGRVADLVAENFALKSALKAQGKVIELMI